MKVVDCSVVVKVAFFERHSDLAEVLLSEMMFRDEIIVAPHFLPIEYSNALRKRVRSKANTPDAVAAKMSAFYNLGIRLLPISDQAQQRLTVRALALANELDLPATYDAHYIALAETYDCEFWTADERLLNLLAGRLPFMRSLADYGDGPGG